MSNLPIFAITPGSAPAPSPVKLTLAPGYSGTASITDVCGHAIPGASVSVTGLIAYPTIPASYHGTFFVAWKISRDGAGHKSLAFTMTLASRQRVGAATSCPAIAAAAQRQQAISQPRNGSLVVLPGHGGFPVTPVAAGGGGLLVLVAAAAVLWRRLHPSGAHHKGARRG